MSPAPDLSMTDEEVRSFLAEPVTAVLSTLGPGGFPHAVTMYYVVGDEDLRMWPYAKSQKVRNLQRDPRCSVLVEHGLPYQDLRGVLIRSNARVDLGKEAVFELGRAIYERYFLPRTGVPFDRGPAERIAAQSTKRAAIVIPIENVASWNHARSPAGGP